MLDGQAVVRERCENSNIATYFTSARGIEYRRDDTAEDPGNPSRHVVRWYLYDGLGSVIAEVGENVFMEADNTPSVPVLGVNRLDVYGNDLGGSSGASSHKFVGKLGHTTEADTGLIYMQARYYDPNLGRFISEDPAGDGVNWYAYCRNNPINLVDENGKSALPALAYRALRLALAMIGIEIARLNIIHYLSPFTSHVLRTLLAGYAAYESAKLAAMAAAQMESYRSPQGKHVAFQASVAFALLTGFQIINMAYNLALSILVCIDPCAHDSMPTEFF